MGRVQYHYKQHDVLNCFKYQQAAPSQGFHGLPELAVRCILLLTDLSASWCRQPLMTGRLHGINASGPGLGAVSTMPARSRLHLEAGLVSTCGLLQSRDLGGHNLDMPTWPGP